jgi:hypothetical protein
MPDRWMNRESRRQTMSDWPRFRTDSGPMQWWWAPAVLLGVVLAIAALSVTGEVGAAVLWGLGSLAGGLIAGGVRHLAWLRRTGTSPDEDRLILDPPTRRRDRAVMEPCRRL